MALVRIDVSEECIEFAASLPPDHGGDTLLRILVFTRGTRRQILDDGFFIVTAVKNLRSYNVLYCCSYPIPFISFIYLLFFLFLIDLSCIMYNDPWRRNKHSILFLTVTDNTETGLLRSHMNRGQYNATNLNT
jgi:hypothetical protein